MTLSKHADRIDNLHTILVMIYAFVDDFLKNVMHSIQHALERPRRDRPPTKTYNLSVAELVTLAIFKFFTGHKNWKDFYRHVKTYHKNDFPRLPNYQNFLAAVNRLSSLALLLLQGFMNVFKKNNRCHIIQVYRWYATARV